MSKQVFIPKGYKGNQYMDIVLIENKKDDDGIFTEKFVIYFYDENPQDKAVKLYVDENKDKKEFKQWIELNDNIKAQWVEIAKNILRGNIFSSE